MCQKMKTMKKKGRFYSSFLLYGGVLVYTYIILIKLKI